MHCPPEARTPAGRMTAGFAIEVKLRRSGPLRLEGT